MSGTRTNTAGNAITWLTSRIKASQARLRKLERRTVLRRNGNTIMTSIIGNQITSGTILPTMMTIDNNTNVMEMNMDATWVLDNNAQIGDNTLIGMTTMPNLDPNEPTPDSPESNGSEVISINNGDGNSNMEGLDEDGATNGQTVMQEVTLNGLSTQTIVDYFQADDPTGVMADTFLIMAIITALVVPPYTPIDTSTIEPDLTALLSDNLNTSEGAFNFLVTQSIDTFFNQTTVALTINDVLDVEITTLNTDIDVLNEVIGPTLDLGYTNLFNLFRDYYNSVITQDDFRLVLDGLFQNVNQFPSTQQVNAVEQGIEFQDDKQDRYNILNRVMFILFFDASGTNTATFTNTAPNPIGATNGDLTMPNTEWTLSQV